MQYRRNLPHILPPGATIFFTFRLADSIPQTLLQQLLAKRDLALLETRHLIAPEVRLAAEIQIKKQHFARYDKVLDLAAHGPTWLKIPTVAELVAHEIQLLCELKIIVLAFCVMSNHVHLVVQLPEATDFSAARMMQRLKGRTALAANRIVDRVGRDFWRAESYDHVVRNQREEERVIDYVLNNPVKAGLVDDWTKWAYSFVR